MIELRKAYKVYNRGKRNEIKAIDHTSLTFGEQGMVAILGASGCGKTTLLNVIGGLDKPNFGDIYVNGKKMNSVFSGRTDDIRNANIGYIFQNYHLVDNMTVFDNVALVLKMLGIRNKEEVKRSVSYVLEKVGLYRYRNRPVDTLSGGERQRVGIARALVKNPGIIIADEPTGNLDSRNSLEVMRIIKAISRDKLVILVTHEKKLAEFFADRIIDVVDGKVTGDRENSHGDDLDYRIDNKIYLQDLPLRQELAAEQIKVDYVSDGSVPMNVQLVVKDGNLYIRCDGHKVDVVEESGAIELVDDHYRALTQEESAEYAFDYTQLSQSKKRRYHRMNHLLPSIFSGFKTIRQFSVIKKLLLVGFVVASGFIMYAYSSYIGINTVTDDEFIQVNKNYVTVTGQRNTVSGLAEYAAMEGVSYVLPGNSAVNLTMDFSGNYYQTNQQLTVSGSLASAELLAAEDVFCGRLPEAAGEIVIDRQVLKTMIDAGDVVMLGIPTEEDFVGHTVYLPGRQAEKLTIVGVVDLLSPCIYARPGDLADILCYGTGTEEVETATVDADNNADIADVRDAGDTLTLTRGEMPDSDYEVLLPESMRDSDCKLGAAISGKVNGTKLTIVGFYESADETESRLFATANTCYMKWLSTTSGVILCCDDCAAITEQLQSQGIKASYCYAEDRAAYVDSIKESVRTTVIVTAVIAAIAVIEIYLMLRSSFLSRVKEVGTLRAIGVKKGDIYCSFLGEVLAITLLTATPGLLIVGYIMKALVKYSYFANLYAMNGQVVLWSILTVLACNIVAGLLPVFMTLRKTPAAILARTDVD